MRKWVRKKDSTVASNKAIDKGGSSTSRLINIKLSSINIDLSLIKPPTESLLEPLLHQSFIQNTSKKAERRQRIDYTEDFTRPVEDVFKPL